MPYIVPNIVLNIANILNIGFDINKLINIKN